LILPIRGQGNWQQAGYKNVSEQMMEALLARFDETDESDTERQDEIAALCWQLCETIAKRDGRDINDVIDELPGCAW
jgi:hypothetical protein